MRTFATGATRDADKGKLDYEGFLSPLVLKRYAEYMHEHRVQADGTSRASDNWQKGIPLEVYMKSMMRHVMEVWALHRGWEYDGQPYIEEALCALLFNVMGYLHELEVPYASIHTDGGNAGASATECTPIQDMPPEWRSCLRMVEEQSACNGADS